MTGYYTLLMKLGITPNYVAFSQTAFALKLIRGNPDALQLVTKCLYPDVAKQFGTNWKAVERNIRTVNEIVWQKSGSLLGQLAGRELRQKPSNAQLLAILSYSLLSQCASTLAAHDLGEAAALPGEGHGVGVMGQAVPQSGILLTERSN